MAFELNYRNKLDIDILGNTDLNNISRASWKPLAAGITTITPSANDKTDETPYYDGLGATSTDVTGKTLKFTVAGHRLVGDPAQDYIVGLFNKIGDDVKTLVRWTDPEGNQLTILGTITAIVPFGGAANVKGTLSFTISANGQPVATPATSTVPGSTVTPIK
jgi:hypothetical protein